MSRKRDGIDLYSLLLGAGGDSVRLSGRIFEAVAARPQRRDARDLYHSALEVHAGRHVLRASSTSGLSRTQEVGR